MRPGLAPRKPFDLSSPMRSGGIPTTLVDGQRLLLPDDAALDALARSPELDGRPVGAGRIFARYRALAARFPEVSVALGEAREAEKPWIVYHLVRDAAGEPVRVHLESQVCEGCGASRVTGLVRHLALYEGAPDPWAALEASAKRPPVPCPGCGRPFRQPPFWAAP